MIEPLELRRLCASVHRQPAFSLDDNGTLRISGSAGDDVIYVGGNNGDVRLGLNGRRMVLTRSVRRAGVYGGAGNDRLVFSSANVYGQADFPVYADGGSGNDLLVTGSGGDAGTEGDTLLGGEGYEFEVPPSEYVSTLATRDARLVLSYRPARGEVRRRLAPTLRDDGRIGVTVTYDYPTTKPREPEQRMFVTFSERDTARARAKGVVLTRSGPAAGRPKDREILRPQ